MKNKIVIYILFALLAFVGIFFLWNGSYKISGNGEAFDGRENARYQVSVKAALSTDKRPASGKVLIKELSGDANFRDLNCSVKYARTEDTKAVIGADCSDSLESSPWLFMVINDNGSAEDAKDTVGWSRTSDKTAIIEQVNKMSSVAKTLKITKGDFRIR